MTPRSRRGRLLARHAGLGAVLGILVLHPATSAIAWLEIHPGAAPRAERFWSFAGRRVVAAFTPSMLPMTGAFALVGSVVGLAFGLYFRGLVVRRRAESMREVDLARDIASLVRAGEGERAEFKASARWDFKLGRTNTELEDAVAKTIAGFMNHHGGTLLVGVADSGNVVGLQHDYQTLRRKDRDGFEQFIVSLVRVKLGGDLCPLVHFLFSQTDGKDLCRIAVEPSERPVYCQDGAVARYFLRMGNSTRELDVREAVLHIAERWPTGGHGARHPVTEESLE